MANTKSPTKPLTRRLRPVLGRSPKSPVVSYMVIVNNIHIGFVHKGVRGSLWHVTNIAGKPVVDKTGALVQQDSPELAACRARALGIKEGT